MLVDSVVVICASQSLRFVQRKVSIIPTEIHAEKLSAKIVWKGNSANIAELYFTRRRKSGSRFQGTIRLKGWNDFPCAPDDPFST